MQGRTIGRFKILERIGQGGMASVWKAEDSLTGRLVAFKSLSPELSIIPKARRRFLREAQNAARLDHPRIAPVLASGEEEDVIYIVFALIEGETLADRISRAPMESGEGVRIAIAAAEALDHAHQRGMVHRDVSTRNVMLKRDGGVVLIDFGIALSAVGTRLTSQEATIGTVAYLSPEVALGRDAEPRSDLYSLAVVLYETLTGSLPYLDRRAEAYMFAVAHRPPMPPRQWRPDLSASLERFLLRAMSKLPSDRPETARDFIRELTAALNAADVRQPEVENPADLAARPLGVELPRPTYLAVIPFDDRSTLGDSEARIAFAGGFASALGGALNGIRDVHLVPLPPAFPIAEDDLPRLARQLEANAFVRGSVRRSGNEIRVSWSLILPHPLIQIAGGNVDGSMVDLFALEDRLAAAIRRALGADDFPRAAGARRHDPAARERYLQALGYLRRYDHAGSIEGAIGLLEKLVDSEEPSSEFFTALARAYLYKHRLTLEPEWERRAEAMCQRAAELDPDGVDVAIALGDLRSHAGRRDLAENDYRRALSLRPDHADALAGMASTLRAAGRLSEAERYAEAAVAAQPGQWRHHNLLGIIRQDQGRFAEAVEPFTRVVNLTPDNARGHLNLASVHYWNGDTQESMSGFRRSIEIEPSAGAYVSLGTSLFGLGRHEEAIEAYHKAAALLPSDPRVWGHLGSALRWMPDRREQCREPLERAVMLQQQKIERRAATSDDLCLLASWLSNLERHDAAIEAIERALALDPKSVRVMAAAIAAYHLAGDPLRAREYLSNALRHGYPKGILLRNPALATLIRAPEISEMFACRDIQEGEKK
jgi:serine/threonine-protein kinase